MQRAIAYTRRRTQFGGVVGPTPQVITDLVNLAMKTPALGRRTRISLQCLSDGTTKMDTAGGTVDFEHDAKSRRSKWGWYLHDPSWSLDSLTSLLLELAGPKHLALSDAERADIQMRMLTVYSAVIERLTNTKVDGMVVDAMISSIEHMDLMADAEYEEVPAKERTRRRRPPFSVGGPSAEEIRSLVHEEFGINASSPTILITSESEHDGTEGGQVTLSYDDKAITRPWTWYHGALARSLDAVTSTIRDMARSLGLSDEQRGYVQTRMLAVNSAVIDSLTSVADTAVNDIMRGIGTVRVDGHGYEEERSGSSKRRRR